MVFGLMAVVPLPVVFLLETVAGVTLLLHWILGKARTQPDRLQEGVGMGVWCCERCVGLK